MGQKRIDELTAGTVPLADADLLIAKQGSRTVKVPKSTAGFVNTTGTQTIAGAKTFSSPLIVQTATDDTHAVPLAQVQSLVGTSSFNIGDIKQTPIAPSAGGAWVDLDVADQTLSTTNYTNAGSLRNVKAPIKIAGVTYTDFTGTVSGSNVTIANNAQGIVFVATMAAHLANSGTATLNVNGTDYAVVSATVSTLVIVVTGSPTTGSQTCIWYVYRTTTATEIKLHAEGGISETDWIPFPAGTYTVSGVANSVTVAAGKTALMQITTNPTKGATPATDLSEFRIFNGNMLFHSALTNTNAGSAGSGNFVTPMPSPYVYNNKIQTIAIGASPIAKGSIGYGRYGSGSWSYGMYPFATTTNSFMVFLTNDTTNAYMTDPVSTAGSGWEMWITVPLYMANIENVRAHPIGYGIGTGRAIYLGDYTA